MSKRLKVFLKTGLRCGYCGINLSELDSNDITIDHIRPRSMGGGNSMSNLVGACRSCNGAKRNMNLEQFRLKMAFKKGMGSDFDYLKPSIKQMEWLYNNTDIAKQYGIEPQKFLFETCNKNIPMEKFQ